MSRLLGLYLTLVCSLNESEQSNTEGDDQTFATMNQKKKDQQKEESHEQKKTPMKKTRTKRVLRKETVSHVEKREKSKANKDSKDESPLYLTAKDNESLLKVTTKLVLTALVRRKLELGCYPKTSGMCSWPLSGWNGSKLSGRR
jgi:hypothetical protein